MHGGVLYTEKYSISYRTAPQVVQCVSHLITSLVILSSLPEEVGLQLLAEDQKGGGQPNLPRDNISKLGSSHGEGPFSCPHQRHIL